MSELALAAFAAACGAHLVAEPRSARFAAFSRTFDERAYLARLRAAGIRWVARSSDDFPRRLASLHDPPPGLFVRGGGELELLAGSVVAIVGARACSPYGADVAYRLGRRLAAEGVAVVSGLARGVDAAAHRGALTSGRTVAVLGCGVDRDYPRAHAQLATEIATTGLVVSEYPPGVEPAPWRFPARNRIVAGLAQATVVVEARARSGALITADLALDEGREVMAVPGEITSALSEGSNALLRLGATPVTSAEDVLAAIGLEPSGDGPSPGVQVQLEPGAAAVLARVRDAPAAVDELARVCELAPAVVAAALSELELHGLVVEADGLYRGVMRGR